MVSAPSQQSRNGARRKVKITARAAADFHQTASPLDRMWDTQLGGFHMVRKRSVTSWRILYRNTAGKERAITLGRYPAMTADQARKLAHEKLAEIYQGGDPLSARQVARDEAKHREAQTLAAYLEGPYTVYQGRRKKGAETLARIRRDFAAWLAKPMSSLTRTDVDRWQADMEERGLAFSSLKRSYGALNTMLNVAVERGAIPVNPLKGVKLERPALSEEELAEATSARRYLEDQEVVALFAGLEAYQEQKRAERRRSRYHGKPWLPDLDQVPYVDYAVPLISLMFYTGFRPGDLHGLRWEHINLTFGTIRKVIEKTAHTRPEPQTFPLSTEAVAEGVARTTGRSSDGVCLHQYGHRWAVLLHGDREAMAAHQGSHRSSRQGGAHPPGIVRRPRALHPASQLRQPADHEGCRPAGRQSVDGPCRHPDHHRALRSPGARPQAGVREPVRSGLPGAAIRPWRRPGRWRAGCCRQLSGLKRKKRGAVLTGCTGYSGYGARKGPR